MSGAPVLKPMMGDSFRCFECGTEGVRHTVVENKADKLIIMRFYCDSHEPEDHEEPLQKGDDRVIYTHPTIKEKKG